MITEHRLVAFDATPLYYRRIVPSSPVKSLIFLLHGIGEHGGRYLPLAEYLAEMGFESWAPDLRGFGLSGGKRGCARSFCDYETDLIAMYSYALKNHGHTSADHGHPPVFFLGHSFGGLLAAAAASRSECSRLRGLILCSPLFGIAIPLPVWQRGLAAAASVIAPDFTQDTRVEGDLLTHDPRMRLQRACDPLIHRHLSVGLYAQIQKKMSESGRMASRTLCASLILQAGDDRIVSKERTEAFFRNLAAPDKQMYTYDGWYHEILNETQRDLVFSCIGRWVAERL